MYRCPWQVCECVHVQVYVPVSAQGRMETLCISSALQVHPRP